MAATSSFIGGSPMLVTSGYTEALLLKGMVKVQKIYWEQPTTESTSNLIIKQMTTDSVYQYVNMKCELSGQSQQMDFTDGTWWKDPYISCVPTGNLWIYYK